MRRRNQYTSLQPLNLQYISKEDLKAYFNNAFELYESLFSTIRDDKYFYTCPDRLRLPLIFYYGHTSAFAINKLVLGEILKPEERVDRNLETIFETGVDEMSWDDIENNRMGCEYKWPSVSETYEYRQKVKILINRIINDIKFETPITRDSKLWALIMGIEHELVHLETTSVLIRQLPINMVINNPPGWNYCSSGINEVEVVNEMIKVKETKVVMGKNVNSPFYGWDLDYGNFECVVSDFEASKYLITNEEYLKFVQDNGYSIKDYWSNEGWKWVCYRQIRHPSFWICPNECKTNCGKSFENYSHCQKNYFDSVKKTRDFPYKLRVMFDIIEMPTNWPVEVTYHEAKAYCKWKGNDYRLLSEVEHHALREHEDQEIFDHIPLKYNHSLVFGSTTPVNYFQSNDKGFNDVFGNLWQWCEDHANGLNDFNTSYLYHDYSMTTFDGRHNIMLGGSWISTGSNISKYTRNMFRRHFIQHCGFRLARSIVKKPHPHIRLITNDIYLLGIGFVRNEIEVNPNEIIKCKSSNRQYELDNDSKLLEREIILNYNAKDSLWINKIVKRIVNLNEEESLDKKTLLHIGSSVGRISFELSKYFKSVLSIDFCAQFIDYCLKLQSQKTISYPQLEINFTLINNSSNILFKQLSWLPNEIPISDFILFTSIDTVEQPLAWLKRFKEILNPNGLLVIYSAKSVWYEENISEIIGNKFKFIYMENIIKGTLTIWKFN